MKKDSRSFLSTSHDQSVSQGGVHGKHRPIVRSSHHSTQYVIFPHTDITTDGTCKRQVILKRSGEGGDKLIKSSKRGRTDVILYVSRMLVHPLWQSTCKGWWATLDPGQEAEWCLVPVGPSPFPSLSFVSGTSLGQISPQYCNSSLHCSLNRYPLAIQELIQRSWNTRSKNKGQLGKRGGSNEFGKEFCHRK